MTFCGVSEGHCTCADVYGLSIGTPSKHKDPPSTYTLDTIGMKPPNKGHFISENLSASWFKN